MLLDCGAGYLTLSVKEFALLYAVVTAANLKGSGGCCICIRPHEARGLYRYSSILLIYKFERVYNPVPVVDYPAVYVGFQFTLLIKEIG